ncbi:hypothetical protein Zmor_028351 [Zophobas morio]|uniref:SWIM-type domain-containing protein n=1 Tax=Zophobas morio TaxID=2755281 RepID=A0AA38HQW9_9CUCU|nr:hypothetical protein Zmor_028351 [Zophobas morio]
MVVGITDCDRHFHPSGLAVCCDETTADFKFIFQSLVDGATKINLQLNPEYLVSDASNAIPNGFLQVFGEDKILIICWAHMCHNVTKKIESLVERRFQDEVKRDIDTLQICSSENIFDKTKELFIKKWTQKGQQQFVDYISNQWFTSHKNWYEGGAHHTPSTNNALESFNSVIKKEETCMYENGNRVLKPSTTIELRQWTKAYQWAKCNLQVTSVKNENSVTYFCPANEEVSVSQEDILNVTEMRWNTFDQFKKRAFKIWIVTLPDNKENWMNGRCTCPSFFKEYICKHIIGLSISLKYVGPPPSAKQVPIGKKPSRGRPKLATRALLID